MILAFQRDGYSKNEATLMAMAEIEENGSGLSIGEVKQAADHYYA